MAISFIIDHWSLGIVLPLYTIHMYVFGQWSLALALSLPSRKEYHMLVWLLTLSIGIIVREGEWPFVHPRTAKNEISTKAIFVFHELCSTIVTSDIVQNA